MKKRSTKSEQESILRSLLNKYQADPEGFRSYLPEVAQELEQLLPSRGKSSPHSALTEQERERLRRALLDYCERDTKAMVQVLDALQLRHS